MVPGGQHGPFSIARPACCQLLPAHQLSPGTCAGFYVNVVLQDATDSLDRVRLVPCLSAFSTNNVWRVPPCDRPCKACAARAALQITCAAGPMCRKAVPLQGAAAQTRCLTLDCLTAVPWLQVRSGQLVQDWVDLVSLLSQDPVTRMRLAIDPLNEPVRRAHIPTQLPLWLRLAMGTPHKPAEHAHIPMCHRPSQ